MEYFKFLDYMKEFQNRLAGEYSDDIKIIGIMMNTPYIENGSTWCGKPLYGNKSIPEDRIIVLTELQEQKETPRGIFDYSWDTPAQTFTQYTTGSSGKTTPISSNGGFYQQELARVYPINEDDYVIRDA